MRLLAVLLLFICGCVQTAAPVSAVAPITDSASVFDELIHAADGGRVQVEMTACELAMGDGVSLSLPSRTTATMTKRGQALVLTFSRPMPVGKARRFGVGFSAGIETLEIERNQVSAITDVLGKRFTWKLTQTP
jgi:hypothetical protein